MISRLTAAEPPLTLLSERFQNRTTRFSFGSMVYFLCLTGPGPIRVLTRSDLHLPLFLQASDLKRHENNMHSERKQLNPLQSDTETLQAAAMAAEEQHLENISCS